MRDLTELRKRLFLPTAWRLWSHCWGARSCSLLAHLRVISDSGHLGVKQISRTASGRRSCGGYAAVAGCVRAGRAGGAPSVWVLAQFLLWFQESDLPGVGELLGSGTWRCLWGCGSMTAFREE